MGRGGFQYVVRGMLLLSVVVILLVIALWLVAIPESLLVHLGRNSLEPYQLSVDIANLRKGLFYNFESQGITLRNESGNALLSLDHFAGRINPWPLVTRELAVSFQGSRDGGSVEGEANLSRKKVKIHARLDSLPLGELPSLTSLGLEAQGILNGALRFEDRRGELRFSIRDLRLKGGSLLGLVMPVDLFSRANGAVIIDGNRRLLSSVSLEGRGLYARVKGEIAGKTMDLQIEIMPDSFLLAEKPSSFSVMEKFKVSPGYYVIPIKTRRESSAVLRDACPAPHRQGASL